MISLHEEMNKAMGHLLTMMPMEGKQVSDFEMALHQKEAEATKAIREANAQCGATIREAEACCTTHIREAKAHHTTLIREAEADCTLIIREIDANCTSIIMEAEGCCAANIRKAESHCAKHAGSIQQSYAESMQHLEMEAMEEKGRDCLSFLATCGLTLCTYPPETHWVLMSPLQILMRNMSLATLLAVPPQVSTAREELTHALTQVAPVPI